MVGGLDARLVPRHTVLTVPCDDDESALLAVVDALGRAGLELERVTVHGVRPAGHHGGGAAA
jgi:hypothetical protein